MAVPHSSHAWLLLAERSALRAIMIAAGFVLMVIGLGFGVSMIMVMPGIVIGLSGAGIFFWGLLGDLPLDE